MRLDWQKKNINFQARFAGKHINFQAGFADKHINFQAGFTDKKYKFSQRELDSIGYLSRCTTASDCV
jgi:hypothetical protein